MRNNNSRAKNDPPPWPSQSTSTGIRHCCLCPSPDISGGSGTRCRPGAGGLHHLRAERVLHVLRPSRPVGAGGHKTLLRLTRYPPWVSPGNVGFVMAPRQPFHGAINSVSFDEGLARLRNEIGCMTLTTTGDSAGPTILLRALEDRKYASWVLIETVPSIIAGFSSIQLHNNRNNYAPPLVPPFSAVHLEPCLDGSLRLSLNLCATHPQ